MEMQEENERDIEKVFQKINIQAFNRLYKNKTLS